MSMSATQQPEFLDTQSFGTMIENMIHEKQITHIEAILELCRARNIELESIPELLTPRIKKLIRNEAINLNLLKKGKAKRLPI